MAAPALRPVPAADFAEIAGRLQRRIIRPPQSNPHQVFLGQTGAGKDSCVRWGVLSAFPLARVVVLITKRGGSDATWDGWGNRIEPGELPPAAGMGPDGTPHWLIMLTPGRTTHADALRLLEQLAAEGEVFVVIGDAASLTDPVSRGGLGCEAIVTRMMDQGRSSRLTVLACANSTAWAASGLKDQAASVWVGRCGGDMVDPFADIATVPKRNVQLGRGAERDAIASLPPRWWLYTDRADGELFARVTTPPGPGSWDEHGLWPDP